MKNKQINLSFIESVKRFTKFVLVGVYTNGIGYSIFIFLTWLSLDPKVVVSMTYPVAVVVGYYSHSKHSFETGKSSKKLITYVIANVIGYVVNIVILKYFVDTKGYPHQLIQLVAIAIVGVILYLLYKFFVFKPGSI